MCILSFFCTKLHRPILSVTIAAATLLTFPLLLLLFFSLQEKAKTSEKISNTSQSNPAWQSHKLKL